MKNKDMNLNRPPWNYLLVVSIATILCFAPLTRASFPGVDCTTDNDCGESQGLIRGFSACVNSTCTNPFEQGCLNVMSEKYGKKKTRFPSMFEETRICNSNDAGGEKRCRKQKLVDYFHYDEVRIAPSNWEGAIVAGWIYQILLTEMLEVPATMENGSKEKNLNGKGSFYDRYNAFVFPSGGYESGIHETLWESVKLQGDCTKTEEPCAHILPDVWDSGVDKEKHVDGRILPPVPNGMIARVGYYVPKFTAKNHPELSTLYGLSGEKNRHNVAANLLTPVSWQLYCNNITKSPTCTDEVAKGPPLNDKDAARYYHAENFTGHFYTPPDGNCTLNPTTCTGHFVNPGCSWATYGEAQMYWNDVPLVSRGSKNNNDGYSYSHMLQIWDAAVATKNNVMIWWWFPDPTIEKYTGTDSSFHRIDWKRTTEKCLRVRQDDVDVCSADVNKRLGSSPLASCDPPLEKPTKLFSRSLKDIRDNASNIARSPVLPTMNQLKIPSYGMDELNKDWVDVKKDFYGYDSRLATCQWVYDNLEVLEQYFPKDYPREINIKKNSVAIGFSFFFAALALIVMLSIGALIAKFKEKPAIRYAQVGFLFWMVTGLFFVAMGAILNVYPYSDGTCVTSEWSILIGYTLELAPILVKVQSVNKVAREAMRFRRIEVDHVKLRRYPIIFLIPVLIYLSVWTAVDMPKSIESLLLDESGDGNIIDLDRFCSSDSEIWSMMAHFWQVALLLSASVLAFQSRDVVEEMNESRKIGFLIYSHFMFLIIRIVVRNLALNGSILGSISSVVVSMLLSFDVLIGIFIYFGPKFYNIATENSKANKMKQSGLAGATRTQDNPILSQGVARDALASQFRSKRVSFGDRKESS